MNKSNPFIISRFDAKREKPRDGIEIPFLFEGGLSGSVRLYGDAPGIPPTIVLVAPRGIEVEVISSADEKENEKPNKS